MRNPGHDKLQLILRLRLEKEPTDLAILTAPVHWGEKPKFEMERA